MRSLAGLLAILLVPSARAMPSCIVTAVEKTTCTPESKASDICGVAAVSRPTLLVFEIDPKVPMPLAQARSVAEYLMRPCRDWVPADAWMPLFVPTDGSMSRSSGRNTVRRFQSRTPDAVDLDVIVSNSGLNLGLGLGLGLRLRVELPQQDAAERAHGKRQPSSGR